MRKHVFIAFAVLALALVGFSVAGGFGGVVHAASGVISPDSSPWWIPPGS